MQNRPEAPRGRTLPFVRPSYQTDGLSGALAKLTALPTLKAKLDFIEGPEFQAARLASGVSEDTLDTARREIARSAGYSQAGIDLYERWGLTPAQIAEEATR